MKAPRPLPKTPSQGTVCLQRVRCGKPACRCARGELHGPYAYLFWREGGRLRKRYVPAGDLPAARAACAERQERERRERDARRAWWGQWRALTALLREVERDG